MMARDIVKARRFGRAAIAEIGGAGVALGQGLRAVGLIILCPRVIGGHIALIPLDEESSDIVVEEYAGKDGERCHPHDRP